LLALPPAQAQPRRLPDLRLLQRPSGHRGLSYDRSQLRVAVDVLGDGDSSNQASALAGASLALEADPQLALTLVGPAHLADGITSDRIDWVAADHLLDPGMDPAVAVRSARHSAVRVASRLVRDGAAAAWVATGSRGPAIAAATFTGGLLPGATIPVLAAAGPGVPVLVDAGASAILSPDATAQRAIAGSLLTRLLAAATLPAAALPAAALPAAALPADTLPSVALLAPHRWPIRPGLADDRTAILDADLRLTDDVDTVTSSAHPDVVVTDGFTGALVLKESQQSQGHGAGPHHCGGTTVARVGLGRDRAGCERGEGGDDRGSRFASPAAGGPPPTGKPGAGPTQVTKCHSE
jgi:hypothetical protein